MKSAAIPILSSTIDTSARAIKHVAAWSVQNHTGFVKDICEMPSGMGFFDAIFYILIGFVAGLITAVFYPAGSEVHRSSGRRLYGKSEGRHLAESTHSASTM